MPASGRVRRPYRAWTARQRQVVVDHYGPLSRDPWPTRRIAEAVGRSVEDTHSAAARWGVAYRPVSRVSYGKVRRYYERGLADHCIAFRVGCTRETVQRWRKRNGLPPVAGRGPGAAR